MKFTIFTIHYQNTFVMKNKLSTFRAQLTMREKEILSCIANGLSSKQIADRLSISLNTVSNHRKNMLLKTGARNSVELLLKNMREYVS